MDAVAEARHTPSSRPATPARQDPIPFTLAERLVCITALEAEIARNDHAAATSPGTKECLGWLVRGEVLAAALRKIKRAKVRS